VTDPKDPHMVSSAKSSSLAVGKEGKVKRLPKVLMYGCLIVSLCGFFQPWITLVFGESAEDWISKGKEADRAAKYEDAVKYYSKALEIDPRSGKALLARGSSCYNLKRWKEARSDCQALVDMNPQGHEALFMIGQTYFQEKDYDQALSFYERASNIKTRPTYALGAAAANFNKRLYHGAIGWCKLALTLNPSEEIETRIKSLMKRAELKVDEWAGQKVEALKKGAINKAKQEAQEKAFAEAEKARLARERTQRETERYSSNSGRSGGVTTTEETTRTESYCNCCLKASGAGGGWDHLQTLPVSKCSEYGGVCNSTRCRTEQRGWAD
jgi:tetratricopeptide (TPR) repeat protein